MEIHRRASAGTLESSDAYVEIEPGQGTVDVEIQSVVAGQFGAQIERAVRDVLADCSVDSARVRVMDRGALDCVIRARVETAVLRGKENP